MFAQTIALFHYYLPGILNRRLLILVGVIYLIGLFLSSFILEISLINSQAIAAGFIADFLRYSLVLLLLLLISSNVAEDYEYRQFERLLTMPVYRWQYIAAQLFIVLATALLLVLPGLLILNFYASFDTVIYWSVALWFELVLIGVTGLLAILSLEKIPSAMILCIAVYLLSKLSGLISNMLAESVYLSDGSLTSRFAEYVFGGILHLLPGQESFAENDVFFLNLDWPSILATQILSASVYIVFILSICLIDFYRKEFNH